MNSITSRGERKGLAFEKAAQFIGSEQLSMVIGLVKIISIIAEPDGTVFKDFK